MDARKRINSARNSQDYPGRVHTCKYPIKVHIESACPLKMLGLYLKYTLIIGHKYVNMLSILNKLTLKRELQNCVTNIRCF